MTKRKKTAYPEVLKRMIRVLCAWPLFRWRMCDKCGHEFRREWIRYYTISESFITLHKRYLCQECISSKAQAFEEAEKYAKTIYSQFPYPDRLKIKRK